MARSNSGGGIGFVGLLTIVFITLKLTNYIEWSWWWVLAPIWGTIVLAIAVFFIVVTISVSNNRRF